MIEQNKSEVIKRMSQDIYNWECEGGECFIDNYFSDNTKRRTWIGFLIGKGYTEYALKAASAFKEKEIGGEDYFSVYGYLHELEDEARKKLFKLCAEFILAIPRMRISYNEFMAEYEDSDFVAYRLKEIELPKYEG